MQKIPVIIISGFLGSGKTTLLTRLMRDSREKGLRFAVLMNELGKADVDGSLIGSGNGDFALEKLFDGCICCDKKSEIAQCMLELLHKKPDVIFIELTGVANPEEIADSLTEPRLLNTVALKRIVTVLDAELTLEYNSIFSADKALVHTLRRQMETADVILLNKTDLADSKTIEKVLKTIRKHNEKAVPLLSVHSAIDTGVLLHDVEPLLEPASPSARPRFQVRSSRGSAAQRLPSGVTGEDGRHEHSRSYSRLQTLCLEGRNGDMLTRKQVESLIRRIPGQLIRAKGYIQTDKSFSMSVFQFAGKRMSWEAAAYAGAPYLVVIGMDLDEAAIRRSWEELLAEAT